MTEASPINPYPRSGPIRGLLIRITVPEWSERQGGRGYHRALIAMRYGVGKYGVCRWCRQSCERRKRWHSECARAMLVAKGAVVDSIYNRPLIKPGPCQGCGQGTCYYVKQLFSSKRLKRECEACGIERPGDREKYCLKFQIDHRVALSIAWERRRLGIPGWFKAWTIGNLQWLCRDCHRIKTASDRRYLANLRKEEPIQ